MKIMFVYWHMVNLQTWAIAAQRLQVDGIEFELFSQAQSAQRSLTSLEENPPDIFIGQLSRNLPGYDALVDRAATLSARAGLTWDMPPGFSSFSDSEMARFKQYLKGIDAENYENAIRYLSALCGADITVAPIKTVRTHGIYHPDAASLFSNAASYLSWFAETNAGATGSTSADVVGILAYYGQVAEKNHADIDTVIRELTDAGMVPMCVISERTGDAARPIEERYPWLSYIKSIKAAGDHRLSAMVNLMAGRLLSTPEDTHILEQLALPVFQMIRLYQQSPDEWEKDTDGSGSGSFNMIYTLAQPEMAGLIEPTLVAGSVQDPLPDMEGIFRRYVPVKERIHHLCRRIKKWIALQQLPNEKKRITIVLNNNPCKGVEATLGLAVGLDTFESLARTIAALRSTGYHVGNAPEEGKALLNMFMDRKAFSEFRWSTVDETVKKGGALCLMDEEQYRHRFDLLPETAQKKVIKDWEPFPGQGMVFNDNGKNRLVVAGLSFGNLNLIVQPKRGCYGAKCNGEVCRILHDPNLSPPHHFLGTYFYISDHSDAVIHFGTHGALEFLPGKLANLSPSCFPEICLDDLPNIYPYVMNVPADGVVAKRRGRAVTVTHLTPVYTPAKAETDMVRLEKLSHQYQKARENRETLRLELLQEQMTGLMQQLNFMDTPSETQFDLQADMLARQMAQFRRTLSPAGMHILGTAPDLRGRAAMLASGLMAPSKDAPSLETIANCKKKLSDDVYKDSIDVLESILTCREDNDGPAFRDKAFQELDTLDESFINSCKTIGDRIAMSTRELPQILRALNGRYIEPGLTGSLSLGKTDALPTGRNLYTTDVRELPTWAAWQVGQNLARNLLERYIKDEGRFPQSIGINLWSIDAFKSDGEVFCQILYLMGIRPVWDNRDRVSKVEPIPLEELSLQTADKTFSPRPRVDVLIQTSGLLRDMVPHFADLVDEAVVMTSRLDEPHDMNFIKKHTDEQLETLKTELAGKYTEKQMARMASFRIFSSPPGTYGVGVGLALDASAWKDETDLTETYVNWGGFAYGSSGIKEFDRVSGQEAHKIYAANLKQMDVTYIRQYSPEYDLLDFGGYAGYLGGMAVAAKALKGKSSPVYVSDVNAVGDLSVRDLKGDLELSVRARLLNPQWIENQKQHGFKGAQSVSSLVNNLYKWSALTQKVGKWVFDNIVETYIENEKNLAWLQNENPYALEEITRRLLEAHSRGLWQAGDDQLNSVRDMALTIEGDMEENIGDVDDEYQGNAVEIMTASDVDKWQPKWQLKEKDKPLAD